MIIISKNQEKFGVIKKNKIPILSIIILLSLFLLVNINISNNYYNSGSFDNSYKQALLSSQMVFINLFKQYPIISKRIIEQLDRINPIHFELIELLSNIFDRSNMNEILEHYYNFPNVPQPINELQKALIKIFTKLHPIEPYKEHLLTGIYKALNFFMRFDKKKSNSPFINKRDIKNNIYIIFNKLYPRLFWLMCYYERRHYT